MANGEHQNVSNSGDKSEFSLRDHVYQSLAAARGLPAEKRAENRRQLLNAVLKRATNNSDATPLAGNLDHSDVDKEALDERISGLLVLIEQAESYPKGYDAVQHRAIVLPPKPPTELTLAEIFSWIEATPNQQHAIGRYQIIPSTLRHLTEQMNVSDTAIFDRNLQDSMAIHLLEQAGLDEFLSGAVDIETFMDALAMIWAGFPLDTGRSAYHGMNGNRATMTRASYEKQFRQIFTRLAEAPLDGKKE